MFHPAIISRNQERLEAALSTPLRRYTFAECEDFAFRMRDVEWSAEGNPSRALTPEEQMFIFHNLHLSKIDFLYWAERFCHILTDEKRMEPLHPWPSQLKILSAFASQEKRQLDLTPEAKLKAILLKSRQVGGTVIGEALVAHMIFLSPRTQGIIASDHPDNSNKLWQVMIRMYDHLPGWMKPHREAKVKATNLYLDRLMSDLIVGSGNQKTTLGQGMNVDAVHLTEVSTWEKPAYIDEDMMPAFESSHKHHTLMLLESTGCGARGNWFHDQFQVALSGDSSFFPIFIAWYDRPGWRKNSEGVEFNSETKAMAARVRAERDVILDKEQMAFYQLTRRDFEGKDQLETFLQEFPSTIEEAFQTGLRSAFSITLRDKIRNSVRPPLAVYDVNLEKKKLREVPLGEWKLDDKKGKEENRLIVWEWAKPGFLYVLGVDVSYGLTGGDSSAVEVLRVGNKWAPDEQVAEWSGNISPVDLASVVEIIGSIWADPIDKFEAKVAVEVNPGSPGIVTQTELMRRGYPHFYTWVRPDRLGGKPTMIVGWWTTPGTRPLLTEMGVNYIKKNDLLLNSPFFVEEMGTFVNVDGVQRDGTYRPTGVKKLAHAPGYHDDRIMALFIALYVSHSEGVKNSAEDRRQWQEQHSIPKEGVKEFQAMGLTWEEAMTKWEQSLVY